MDPSLPSQNPQERDFEKSPEGIDRQRMFDFDGISSAIMEYL